MRRRRRMSHCLDTGRAVAAVRPVFVRVVATPAGTEVRRATGIFQAAYVLLRHAALSTERCDGLREHLDWFNENLPAPDRFVRSRSNGFYRRPPIAVSWFRQEAAEHIAHAEALAREVAAEGPTVQTLRTVHPGYVVYQDEYQVVAVPFRDRLAE